MNRLLFGFERSFVKYAKHAAPNNWITVKDELWRRSWPVLRYRPTIYLKGLNKRTKNLRTAGHPAGNRTWKQKP